VPLARCSRKVPSSSHLVASTRCCLRPHAHCGHGILHINHPTEPASHGLTNRSLSTPTVRRKWWQRFTVLCDPPPHIVFACSPYPASTPRLAGHSQKPSQTLTPPRYTRLSQVGAGFDLWLIDAHALGAALLSSLAPNPPPIRRSHRGGRRSQSAHGVVQLYPRLGIHACSACVQVN
jgi:hypothetical protein